MQTNRFTRAPRSALLWVLIALLFVNLLPVNVSAETDPGDETVQDGYTETKENYSTEVALCANGQETIFGKFYYPTDFDSAKHYPVIIMSNGVGVTHTIFEKAKWVDFATAHGCIAYAFDFCGSSERSLSTMAMEDMTIDTEISDLNAVIDFVTAHSFVDKDYVFLMGQSFGGLISAITAPARDNDIRGLFLLYPAICAVDMVHEMFTSVKDIPKEGGKLFNVEHPKAYFKALYNLDLENTMKRFNGDVLIIHGEQDPTVPISYSQHAAEDIYADGQAELLTITGKGSIHAFELVSKEGLAAAQEKAAEFLEKELQPYRKIACIGDSITYGMLRDPKGVFYQLDNYPLNLQKMLGEGWKVYNYGQPGSYAIKDDGKLCYWNIQQFIDSRNKDAEAYTIMLGTNDSARWDADAYRESLSALVDAYRESSPDAVLFLMISPTAYPNPNTGEVMSGISAETLNDEIPGIVTAIAEEKGAYVIDLHSFTADHADWFVDGIHPNGEGHQYIAKFICENILDVLNLSLDAAA